MVSAQESEISLASRYDFDQAIKRLLPQDNQTDLGKAVAELAKNPKVSQRFLSEKFNQLAEHEMKMGIIRMLREDPDSFYKLLIMGSAGIAILGWIGITFAEDHDGTLPGIAVSNGAEASFVLIPAGLALGGFAALMLAFPRVFGPDGFKVEAEASVIGLAGGSIKIG